MRVDCLTFAFCEVSLVLSQAMFAFMTSFFLLMIVLSSCSQKNEKTHNTHVTINFCRPFGTLDNYTASNLGVLYIVVGLQLYYSTSQGIMSNVQ